MDSIELTPEEKEALAEIRKRKSLLVQEHRIKKSTAESKPIGPEKLDKDRIFTTKRMGRQLSSFGLDPSAAIERIWCRSLSRKGCKRDRSAFKDGDGGEVMDVDGGDESNKKLRLRSRSRSLSMSRFRSHSRPPGEVVPGEGFKDLTQKLKALKVAKKSAKKRNRDACKGEADSRCLPEAEAAVFRETVNWEDRQVLRRAKINTFLPFYVCSTIIVQDILTYHLSLFSPLKWDWL